jgi:ABC-type enterobactin transport system permease subunit
MDDSSPPPPDRLVELVQDDHERAFDALDALAAGQPDDLGVVQSAIAWTTGSLTGTDWEQVRMALPWTVVAMGLALVSARQLNVLLLGDVFRVDATVDSERPTGPHIAPTAR